MKREPSIHVTMSQLRNILGEVLPSKVLPYLDVDTLEEIFRRSRLCAVNNRSIMTGKRKTVNKARKGISSSLGQANMLADIIYSRRVQLKHIGVTKIKQTDNQWGSIKELVPVVNSFCEKEGLDIREGYIEFVKIGLDMLSKGKKPNYNYCASNMLSRADQIVMIYEAKLEVDNDPYPNYTKELYDLYNKEVLSRVGISSQYTEPVEYVHFVRARGIADELGVDYEVYIKAQFHALEFFRGIPAVQDLDQEVARDRVIKYMSKFNITAKSKTIKTDPSVWDSFKN